MASYPNRAVKKFTKPAHREIAVGILIAYGLFPCTNDGIAQAEKLIAGRETWLAPSDLPNYYDNIESDLMTGNETAGIVNIRMILKEFYGLTDTKTSKSKVITGKTTVYKPEDKFVDDVQEELDQKLEEKSNEIMDVVDALIEKQKKDFEDFKKKQQEQLEAKKKGENQYPTPIGPDPMQGPVEPPVQGPKAPPKKTVAPEKDEDWESEVPDQLGTKLDELIEQVKNDPLPKPAGDRRKRTKGKKIKRSQPRYSEMHVGSPLAEVMDNVIEAKNALLDLYKVTKKSFEFKKSIDKTLTQRLQNKKREAQIEDKLKKPTDAERASDKDKKEKESNLKKILKKSLEAGLITAIVGTVVPLFASVFPKNNKEEDQQSPESDTQPPPEGQETPPPSPILPPPEGEETPPPAPVLPPPEGQETPTPAPVLPPPEQATPAPTLPPPAPPAPAAASPSNVINITPAAEGRKFDKKKSEPLKPLSIPVNKEKQSEGLSKAVKPLLGAVALPMKVGAGALLSFAHSIVNPFAMFMPPPVKSFINNIFSQIADSAGLLGASFQVSGDSFVDVLKKALEGVFGGKANAATTNPDSSLVPDGSPNNFKGSTGQEQAMNFFTSKGLTAAQSAGIVGNLMQESGAGLDPKAKNSQGNRGIAQWDANRWGGFEKFAKQKGLDVNTRESQLQWIWEEMRTGSGGLGLQRFKSSAQTAEQAAALFLTDYERSGEKPGSHGYDVRLKNARALQSKFKYTDVKPAGTQTPAIGATPKQQYEQSVNSILGLNPPPPPAFTIPSFDSSARSSTAGFYTLQPGL